MCRDMNNPYNSTGAKINALQFTGKEINQLEKLALYGKSASSTLTDEWADPLWSSLILFSRCLELLPVTRCRLPGLFPGWQLALITI